MPQKSLLFSAARVRVMEKSLMGPADMAELIDAQDAQAALQGLKERGFFTSAKTRDEANASSGDVLFDMLEAERENARGLLKELSCDQKVSDAFLLKTTLTDICTLIKRRIRGDIPENGEAARSIADNALIPPTLLLSMVKNKMYFDLPEPILNALSQAEAEIEADMGIGTGTRGRIPGTKPDIVNPAETDASDADSKSFDPSRISTIIFRAYYEYALSLNDAFFAGYFATELDFINIATLFRIKALGKGLEELRDNLMPEGAVKRTTLEEAFSCEDESRAKSLALRDLSGDILSALKRVLFDDDSLPLPTRIERERTNYLIEYLKSGRDDMESMKPIIGFYLAKLREIDEVQLIITLKRSGFDVTDIKARTAKLYKR